ncbi:hypothetical protein A1359_15100 [Methylomonas lenta]|uniref:Band 7 domain-containing protein n=1 Tax=Methylomonas lenta TaxID=980561 RepID=A0A177N0F6_9GAMM|nr:SPFH domain-containing protein [Methylomonas lenta]OAI11023.1 hypothetical protein A1359_15100 [Methylomonas lenta]
MSTSPFTQHTSRWPRNIKLWHLLLLIATVLLIISPPWFIVQPSEMAGVRRLGRVITPSPLAEGFYFKLPLLDINDNLQVSLTAFQVNDLPIFTVDQQWINVSVGISFTVPESSVLKLLYMVGRSGNFDIDQSLRPVICESVMLVFSHHPAETLTENRAEIVKELEIALSATLQRVFGLDVHDVQITNILYLSARAALLCDQLKSLNERQNSTRGN